MANRILNDPHALSNAATYDGQARPDAGDTFVWSAALRRTGVLTGCTLTQHAGLANMSVDVATGSILILDTPYNISSLTTLTIQPADSSFDRVDIITVDSGGVPIVTQGTPAAIANWPVVAGLDTALVVCLGLIYIPANTLAILNSNIVDKREILAQANIPSYTYYQNTPSASAVVTHNLGFFPPVVTVTLSGDVIEGDIEYIDSNSLRVTFALPFSWIAYIN